MNVRTAPENVVRLVLYPLIFVSHFNAGKTGSRLRSSTTASPLVAVEPRIRETSFLQRIMSGGSGILFTGRVFDRVWKTALQFQRSYGKPR